MSRRDHWKEVYSSKPVSQLGWYAPRLSTSLDWIRDLELAPDAPIIDVGCGASTLVDDLLDAGYTEITLLDIAETACAAVAKRLGPRYDTLRCMTADVTNTELPADHFALWHDRAVFHFLTDGDDRRRYKDVLLRSLRAGGWFLIGTFSPEAPPKCSGLPVRRYSVAALAGEFGPELELIRDEQQLHVTPGGVEQLYQYGLFRR